jgi:hypothetical protein
VACAATFVVRGVFRVPGVSPRRRASETDRINWPLPAGPPAATRLGSATDRYSARCRRPALSGQGHLQCVAAPLTVILVAPAPEERHMRAPTLQLRRNRDCRARIDGRCRCPRASSPATAQRRRSPQAEKWYGIGSPGRSMRRATRSGVCGTSAGIHNVPAGAVRFAETCAFSDNCADATSP